MKKVLIFLSVTIAATLLLAITPPTNLPSNSGGNRSVLQNADGSLSISGDSTQPSQVGLRSTNGANYAFITGPTNAILTYNIFLPSIPTNGVFVVSADSTGTNLTATFVQGYTGNYKVVSPTTGSTVVTNQVYISSGVITNVTQLP